MTTDRMTAREATELIQRATDSGMNLMQIVVELECGLATIYLWRRAPESRVNVRLTRNLRQLAERLRAGDAA